MRRIAIVVVLALGFAGVAGAFTANPPGVVRGVVVLVGDSNTVRGAAAMSQAMSPSAVGYVPVHAGVPGATVRFSGCAGFGCPVTAFNDYWATRIPALRARIDAHAWVVALGINDAREPGTATGRGYAAYSQKIDYVMALLPTNRPVLWSNLPCSLEPEDRREGCKQINYALALAPARWPNLRIVRWAGASLGHPEYMVPDDVHYTPEGYAAYAATVVDALDAVLP